MPSIPPTFAPLQALWLPDDLSAVDGAAGDAVTAGIALLRFAAKPDETPEADRGLCDRMRWVLHTAQKTRGLARPLTKELVEAHNRSGSKLPTICGVTDAFAVGLAASFAYATLEAYCLPFETDDSWGSTFCPNPPADPSIMPKIRKRLRGLAIPDGKTLRELIDKEVRTAATIRLGVDQATAPPAGADGEPNGRPASCQTVPAKTSKIALALAVLTDHPDWTNEKIAGAAGCNVKYLSQAPKFKTARAAIRGLGQERQTRDRRSRGADMDRYAEGD